MVRKICNALTTIILILLAALAVLLLVPRFMGFRTFAVLSGSMEPGIPVGSIVYTKEIEPQELVAGDVLTYKINGTTMVLEGLKANGVGGGYIEYTGGAYYAIEYQEDENQEVKLWRKSKEGKQRSEVAIGTIFIL